MFTGLIQGVGVVQTCTELADGKEVSISWGTLKSASIPFNIGDSIALNGVCSTIIQQDDAQFTVQFLKETLDKTTFKSIQIGQPLNLESCVTPTTALGGHMVSGHVDGTAKVLQFEKNDPWAILTLQLPDDKLHYVIPKGSLTIDGISLTIAEIQSNNVTVHLIPHTLDVTNLGSLKAGSSVNIEYDIVGKYLYNFYRRDKE